MSHQPARAEKDCLNCGAQVPNRFCSVCGQENIVPHQNFWSLTRHFIYDIFHFDGKFFDTLRHLFFRPGSVPLDYVRGKRASYLDPIRMYLFTSALFFLVFFSVSNPKNIFEGDDFQTLSWSERFREAAKTYPLIKNNPADTGIWNRMDLLMDTTRRVRLDKLDSTTSGDSSYLVQMNGSLYRMRVNQPDTGDEEEEKEEKGWLNRKINERMKKAEAEHGGDQRKVMASLTSSFLHRLPYLFFISIPFFALLLKLVYTRRKGFFYSDHAIFTLYFYIFSFLLYLFNFLFEGFERRLGWGIFDYLQGVIFLILCLYLLLAMKRFYAQRWGKTLGKFFILSILVSFVLLLLFTIFALLSLLF